MSSSSTKRRSGGGSEKDEEDVTIYLLEHMGLGKSEFHNVAFEDEINVMQEEMKWMTVAWRQFIRRISSHVKPSYVKPS